MKKLIQNFKQIKRLNKEWLIKAQARLDSQTRPQGSLGHLEEAIVRLVAIQQRSEITLQKKRIFIFASDHGVEEESVSCYPREVTKAMVLNFLNGGATINSLARHINADVKVVDMGVDGEFEEHSNLIHAKIRKGTGNIKKEEAMTEGDLFNALQTGWDLIEMAKKDGVDIIGLGEMGIGNTTSAAAIIAAILKCPAKDVTGRGTGINNNALEHKIKVIDQAIKLHKDQVSSPLAVLQKLGGFEIAAMTGAILACAYFSMAVVVDGVVVAASTLIAQRLNVQSLEYVFLAHQSQERGHHFVIEALNQKPLLNLSMRLGEASGAALAINILDAAVKIYNEVATFEEAEVANKKEARLV